MAQSSLRQLLSFPPTLRAATARGRARAGRSYSLHDRAGNRMDSGLVSKRVAGRGHLCVREAKTPMQAAAWLVLTMPRRSRA